MFDVNVPYNDLPPITGLQLDISPKLAKLAEDTRVAIEILNYAVKSLPSPDVLLDTLVLQEAKTSSNIENIITTNDDLYRGAVFDSFTAEAKEVANYKEALFVGYDALKSKGVFSLSDLENINELVNKRAKGVRTNIPNFEDLTRIANKKVDGSTEILYTPPHGKELLQSLLVDMLDFVYDDEMYELHPLIKIALAHYQFESIHPFRDGNGRTGRILNILFLCQKEYLSCPILYASSYIIRNKNKYYSLLGAVKETDDYNSIIKYMLLSFKETAEHTLKIVESIRGMINRYTNVEFISHLKGQKEPLLNTIDLVFKKVYVRVADVVELGIHRQTAATYLDQLVDYGLLSKEKSGKDNLYKNMQLLNFFENNSEVLK